MTNSINAFTVRLEEKFKIPIDIQDLDDTDLAFDIRIENINGTELYHQLHNLTAEQSGTHFIFEFEWQLQSREPNVIKFAATDEIGATATYRAFLLLCDCQNGGSCSQDRYTVRQNYVMSLILLIYCTVSILIHYSHPI